MMSTPSGGDLVVTRSEDDRSMSRWRRPSCFVLALLAVACASGETEPWVRAPRDVAWVATVTQIPCPNVLRVYAAFSDAQNSPEDLEGAWLNRSPSIREIGLPVRHTLLVRSEPVTLHRTERGWAPRS